MKGKLVIRGIMAGIFLFLASNVTVQAESTPERIGGKDRFEVAVNISQKGWPAGTTAETVILTNYLAFADALAATPYAYQKNSPILLTHPSSLTLATKNELMRLKPKEVILAGGSGSLNPSLITEIKQLGIERVSRIDGKNRYEVAKNISLLMNPTGTAVVANGLNFPDALAIAPYAARSGIPILLTGKDALPAETQNALQAGQFQKTIVSGGEGSVSKEVYSKLPGPERIGGKDRYEVASNIFRKYFAKPSKAYIANGLTFADALTSSVLAAKENVPILLTRPSSLPDTTQNVLIDKMMTNVLIIGGTASVNNNIVYLPGKWEITSPGGNSLEGYTSATSVAPGQSLSFYVKSSKAYHVEFYRMGYYNGRGGLLTGTKTGLAAKAQVNSPDSITLNAKWNVSFTHKIPGDWKSGAYLAKLVNTDKQASYIPFVVRDSSPNADFMAVMSHNTYQAYNNWGGKSLYGYNSSNKTPAIKLSFNRPYKSGNGAGEFFAYEYNLIRWLEKNGYNVTYVTDHDIHNGILANSNVKTILIPGHDEYWSKHMRDNIENSPDVNLALFNANIGYWQVRYEDGGRTMVGYKALASQDPYNKIDPAQVTTTFRSPPVNRPEQDLFGSMYRGIPEKTMPMVVTNPSHWIYTGTGLKLGDQIPGVVGGEVDATTLTSNVEIISRSPVTLYGQKKSADVIWFNNPDGRKVFSVGTFYWNWFLDPYGHTDRASYNKNIEIMTKNALNKLLAS
ncbi:N,N-dimethylformamidase beta subunit family domain-containing protein [Bacillus sp. FJAT-27225]|uniref:N,N-dimethylformamidase beta subunit family domain-containing protein n=1 Tax=Bacillus sp. FJAT-27225 TaxID=1743144 RepID=UPI00111285ED|nr:N,N-dimethylformamidase beta subunit family domain-containing protein [Bacillus sp. FJAT-27225]